MVKQLAGNWSLMRIFRLLVGIAALVQAIIYRDASIGFIGGLLVIMAVANIGCCGARCATAPVRQPNEKEITYEEVDSVK